MPRSSRSWTSELSGSFHIISRVAGGERLFGDREKEYFLLLLEKYAKGFFVDVHAFCIMGNHIHILATGREQQALKASHRELLKRHREMYGQKDHPPQGRFDRDGTVIPDKDDGMGRLRSRLGSISRFTQELKQSFSRWYNRSSGRRGFLWSERFKGVIISKGEAQLVCSAYIDLNPIRAGIVKRPEDYRWSSIGLKSRDPRRAKKLLTPLSYESTSGARGDAWYRLFVYRAARLKQQRRLSIPERHIREVESLMGRLKLGNKLRLRFKNLTEGHAIGNKELINEIQQRNKRKHIKARPLINEGSLYTTRVLQSKPTRG